LQKEASGTKAGSFKVKRRYGGTEAGSFKVKRRYGGTEAGSFKVRRRHGCNDSRINLACSGARNNCRRGLRVFRFIEGVFIKLGLRLRR
jgi:hypothetical protein